MTTLTQLTIDAEGTIGSALEHDAGTGGSFYTHCNDAPDGLSSEWVGNDIENIAGGPVTRQAWFSLTNVNSDFGSMDTLNIDVDVQAIRVDNDSSLLSARIFAANNDTGTPLTAETATLGSEADGTRTQRQVAFGTLAGNKSAWDGAHIRFTWTYNKTGGWDDTQIQLYGCDIDGTYTIGGGGPSIPVLMAGYRRRFEGAI